ncbi:MAG: hypothetical protein CV087_05705 [Candidatus Brocadia sp. WS118]|nr:MAG: hypothetical protein CV087_05705 [Candidatus Brocadia sp. WS118]
MDNHELQNSINEFERMIDSRRQGFVMILHDFRPVWDMAREIQGGFNSRVRFPTIEMRQAAWERFRTLRDQASQVFQEQQDQMLDRSLEHRNDILSKANSAEHRAIEDALFFFDRTTVEGMKVKAQQLKNAFAMLSTYKEEMLGEHKQQCHERLREVRESHDLWWSRYKETSAERQSDRQQARESKKDKIRANLESNREKLRTAEERLEKVRDSVRENRSKLEETTSDKWIGLYTEWIEEGKTKIESIESWINTLHEWIREGEEQLDAL